MAEVGRVATCAIPEFDHRAGRRRNFQPSHTENPEVIFAAASQGICGDFAWAFLALEQLREPIA